MDDTDIVRRINKLAEEEHGLERAHEGEELSGQDLERLHELEVALDQCWDLLRQRRAATRARTPTTWRSGPKASSKVTGSESGAMKGCQ